jgi:hypothetical protein
MIASHVRRLSITHISLALGSMVGACYIYSVTLLLH